MSARGHHFYPGDLVGTFSPRETAHDQPILRYRIVPEIDVNSVSPVGANTAADCWRGSVRPVRMRFRQIQGKQCDRIHGAHEDDDSLSDVACRSFPPGESLAW